METSALLRKIFSNRNDASAHFELGLCYKARGEYPKAMKYLIRSIQLDPCPEAVLHLGHCHELCEEYDLARMIYQKVMSDNAKLLPLRFAALRQG